MASHPELTLIRGGRNRDASRAKILVVDDNAAKRLAIGSIVRPLGHPVVEAESGEAALKAVTAETFAVILMDVQMPVMGGYETARLIRMRKQCEHTPIIFVTAHARDESDIPIAYKSGAVDFIFAPIVPDILRAKVSVFVELFLKSHELENAEARTRAVLENVADGIVTVSDEGIIESFNRAATVLFQYSEAQAVGQPFAMLIAAEQRKEFTSLKRGVAQAPLVPPAGRAAESIGCRKDGSTFVMELDFTDLRLDGRTIHVGCLRDVSQRRTYTEMLQHQTLHDPLTDLPNRVLLGDRVTQAIRGSARTGEPLALLLMDLDGFKEVNDTHGHQCGDELLKAVALRLGEALRDGDTIARLGGDEFGILPFGSTDLAGAATVAWKLQQALEQPFEIAGHTIPVRASIGMTLIPEHGDNLDDLLRRADLAMYEAKGSGGGYALFAAEHEEAPARRLALLGDLRRSVQRDELVLHYQPKIDLATGTTTGVEALIRWNHPTGKLLMPAAFMPDVERNELMVPVTEWVVNEALKTLHGWREQGYDLSMAINVGARCLAEGSGFFEMLEELMVAWHIPPDQVTLELTESAFLDTEMPGLLSRLENVAPRLSIDDFGTGYSSLVYLQRLPVVELKADRSFVTSLSSDAVIVRSIIDLAHNLGLSVVAEGVEDEATMNRLMSYGCDTAQGFHFSRALPAADLLKWLETSAYGKPRLAQGAQSLRVQPSVA